MLIAIRERKREELISLGANFSDMPKSLKSSAHVFLEDTTKEIAEAYAEISQELNIVSEEKAERMIRENASVFEGTQGVLLDEWHGFHPYTTWGTTVQKNALELLHESGFDGEIETIGVTRSYATRHGKGPFVTEDRAMRNAYPDEANTRGVWQGNFRTGFLDLVSLRYAVECVKSYGRLDSLAIIHLDVFDRVKEIHLCDRYKFADGTETNVIVPQWEHNLAYQEKLTDSLLSTHPMYTEEMTTANEVIRAIQETLSVPVKYRSFGPTEADKFCV
jgi:adenylosuccinate synthase